jgi:hypothetical protein
MKDVPSIQIVIFLMSMNLDISCAKNFVCVNPFSHRQPIYH